MYHNVEGVSLEASAHLASDLEMFRSVEAGTSCSLWRCWETTRPVVVVGRSGDVAAEVVLDACRADGVPVLGRFSGGGAVVLGPGCLNYAVAFSLASQPALSDVAASFQIILGRIAAALDIPGLLVAGKTDLALAGRKVSGNAQRRGRLALLQHGTLLYAFDPALAARYLEEPPRQPAYRAARPHAEFMGNLPLPAETIRARLETVWRTFSAEDFDHARF